MKCKNDVFVFMVSIDEDEGLRENLEVARGLE